MICRQCGLELPERARFCARCGAALSGPAEPVPASGPELGPPVPAPAARPAARAPTRQRPALWLLLVFWVGSVVPLAIAIIYAVIAIDPTADGGASGLSPADVQRSALLLTVFFGVVLILQVAAAAGLTAGQPWGRVVGTVVCALWMLTCVGIPVAILALTGLWRRSGAARLPQPPA